MTMAGVPRRILLARGSKPKLKPHVRLQFDDVRQAWALLSPERVFWPNEVSLDILRLCDGSRTAAEIATLLCETYGAEEGDVQPDIDDFLQKWSDRALVSLL